MEMYMSTAKNPTEATSRRLRRGVSLSARESSAGAAAALLSPDAPCGCITVLTATLFPAGEAEIAEAVNRQRDETRSIFRKRLMLAIAARQLPADCNLPALAGALVNFFEGLTLQARGDICQSELLEIARLGVRLLPPRQ